eukprot:TRINITY_DN44963_c0_g1_i1.p1 TRINITY_DN44963_c0_g1~~TRINITY_DN44963_c0_g1_i1.p1  ORF type:complete len:507 (-),score=72.03 TRINITY_DN44963_c0_g1_i1:134-1621(-)
MAGLQQRTARVEELGDELVRTIEDAQAQLHQDGGGAIQEFEAARVQLHQEFLERLSEVDKALQETADERTAMSDPGNARGNDVVTINVGGHLFTVKRETMCICDGSFLTDLFSGRWDATIQRDKEGRIFLDFDPAVFEHLLSWLRDKKMETPERPAPQPQVASEDMRHFQAIVDYLGLRKYIDTPGMATDGWRVGAETSAAGFGGIDDRPMLSAAPSLSTGDTSRGPPATGSASESATESEPRGFFGAAGSLLASRIFGQSSELSATSAGSVSAAAANVPSPPPPPPRPVAWSKRYAHPSVRSGEGDEANVVTIADTRLQGGAAAVRATRGYQSGVHYWEVDVRCASDDSYVGFVASQWGSLCQPIGRAQYSWGISSSGAVFECNRELQPLKLAGGDGSRVVFGDDSVVGILMNLVDPGRRSASVFINGHRCAGGEIFRDLPETLYPAVSNMRSAAEYVIHCDIEPPLEIDDAMEASLEAAEAEFQETTGVARNA